MTDTICTPTRRQLETELDAVCRALTTPGLKREHKKILLTEKELILAHLNNRRRLLRTTATLADIWPS